MKIKLSARMDTAREQIEEVPDEEIAGMTEEQIDQHMDKEYLTPFLADFVDSWWEEIKSEVP